MNKLIRLVKRTKYNVSKYLYRRKLKPYYDGYNFWMVLVDECEKVNLTDDIMNNAKQVKRIQCLFDEMSKHYLKRFKTKDIYDIWCNTKEKYDNYKDMFEEFSSYLWYASDRMSINRWLYCRLYITNTFEMFYSTEINEEEFKDWYEISVKIEEDVIKWFKNEFHQLYKNKVDNDGKEK